MAVQTRPICRGSFATKKQRSPGVVLSILEHMWDLWLGYCCSSSLTPLTRPFCLPTLRHLPPDIWYGARSYYDAACFSRFGSIVSCFGSLYVISKLQSLPPATLTFPTDPATYPNFNINVPATRPVPGEDAQPNFKENEKQISTLYPNFDICELQDSHRFIQKA